MRNKTPFISRRLVSARPVWVALIGAVIDHREGPCSLLVTFGYQANVGEGGQRCQNSAWEDGEGEVGTAAEEGSPQRRQGASETIQFQVSVVSPRKDLHPQMTIHFSSGGRKSLRGTFLPDLKSRRVVLDAADSQIHHWGCGLTFLMPCLPLIKGCFENAMSGIKIMVQQ